MHDRPKSWDIVVILIDILLFLIPNICILYRGMLNVLAKEEKKHRKRVKELEDDATCMSELKLDEEWRECKENLILEKQKVEVRNTLNKHLF